MSKIVSAINTMVSSPELITSVLMGGFDNEYYFKYDKKHSWSIMRNSEGEYSLHYYPGDADITELAAIPEEAWSDFEPESVRYSSKDIGTREAIESFRDLHTIIGEKAYGMDDVLNEIIGNE